MLMNANTATRSFRELQFDLKAFLKALMSICPTDDSGDSDIVEIKWADGSVDIVPTYAFIQNIVQNYFTKLKIGSTDIRARGGGRFLGILRQKLSLLISSTGMAAHINEIGDGSEDYRIVKSTITQLGARFVKLPSDARITRLTVSGLISATTCSAGSVTVRSAMNCDTWYARDLDVSGVPRMSVRMAYHGLVSDVSCVDKMMGKSPESFYTGMQVSGETRFTASVMEGLRTLFKQNNTKVHVEVPVMKGTEYAYLDSLTTDIPDPMNIPFPQMSQVSLSTLYPKKQLRGSYDGQDLYIRLLPPDSSDDNLIIPVCNNTRDSLTFCNAWDLSTATFKGCTSVRGMVSPLNYVTLPAFSSMDFLFKFDILGSHIRAYMLPMHMVSEEAD